MLFCMRISVSTREVRNPSSNRGSPDIRLAMPNLIVYVDSTKRNRTEWFNSLRAYAINFFDRTPGPFRPPAVSRLK
jgi:hypothetical protein